MNLVDFDILLFLLILKITSIVVPFSSAAFTKLFKLFLSLELFVLFRFTFGEEFLGDIDMIVFQLKRSKTVDISLNFSNFATFWNCFCSNVRRSVGVKPILTKKLTSLPQNLLYQNPLKETRIF